MNLNLLDSAVVSSMVFYPRPASPGGYTVIPSVQADIQDGTIPITDEIQLGYRFYLHRQEDAPVILFFHGNGEVAAEYDGIAPQYHRAGASLLVVDYRGYGWSTGQPIVSALVTDAERVSDALPGILNQVNRPTVPVFVKGRSLGSAPAVHLAYTYPERFKGLILESSFADVPTLLMRLGLSVAKLAGVNDDPIANARKMAAVHLPLLVIHGEQDSLLPIKNGEKLYLASPSKHKTFLRIANGGHNNLMSVALKDYFAHVQQFIADYSLSSSTP